MSGRPFTVILSHEHTDFDALASMLAASKLHPEAVPVLPRNLNRNLQEFLSLYRNALPFRNQDDLPRRRVDRAIIVDTQSASTIKGMKPDTTGQIIDHHKLQRELEEGWTFWGEEVGATTTLLVEPIAKQQVPVTPVEATLMLLGIYEDTGSLGYVGTTPRDLRAAAWLLDRGANLQVVNRFLNHPLTESQRQLYEELAENSQILDIAGHSVVLATAHAPEYADEISTLAHKLRDVYEPSGLFLVVDLGDRIQIVARSTSDAIHVGAITGELGGGGHARAAAALVRGRTVAQVEEQLETILRDQVKPRTTVDQIMTHGYPITVTPDTTIGDMTVILQRYGFEGYPVVESEQTAANGRPLGSIRELRGIITRRQVDRAQQHGLAAHTVDRYMRTGQVSTTPQQSVNALQKLMIESGWGQIPVVDSDDGQIIGIVTRTDLIKLWGEPEGKASGREQIVDLMGSLLPPALLFLLKSAGEAAHELGFPLYAVGGFARDLLLKRPNFDVDLVVEGDGIQVAQELALRYGGRVRSHRRFGTAKWVLPHASELAAQDEELEEVLVAATPADSQFLQVMNGGQAAGLPGSLDFVTARTEFYAEPTALPTVEHSSIKLDLHRRDFTINTLAICLNPSKWGDLLDFYGGQRDLEEGLIRVLHTHSFVDDPTRILRAVRFEQRFGFRIEKRTAELIDDALDLLDRITAARVRHELELIAAEDAPELALRRLDEIGVTEHLHPALRTDGWVIQRFEALRRALSADPDRAAGLQPRPLLYFAIWTYRLDREQIAAISERLLLTRNTVSQVEDLHQLKARYGRLVEPNLPRSQVFEILHRANETSRFLLGLVEDEALVRERIDLYDRELSQVRHRLDGKDLKALGIKPGPIYRRLFDAARSAWLDGEISTPEEERALIARLIRQFQAQEAGG